MQPKTRSHFHFSFWLSLLTLASLVAAAPLLASGPGTLKLDSSGLEVSESVGVAIVTVERSHGESGAVSVHYATSDGTATAGADYTATAGTLSWADGDAAAKTFAVPITPDAIAEATETIHLTLSDPTGGADIDPDRGTADIQIFDQVVPPGGDDHGGAGSFHFSERSFMTREGNGVAVITVERSGGEHGAVGVSFSTSAGSATPGEDYTETSGTLSWADGDESLRSFSVPILQDQKVESDETVQLSLSQPTGGATLDADRANAVLTILEDGDDGLPGDDDSRNHPAGLLRFDEASFEVIEGETFAVIKVERSGGETGAVTVAYSTADGSAVAGLDYEAASGTLSWPSGDGSARTFQVQIHDDTLQEGNETVNLRLTNPTGGAVLDAARDTSLLTILDNDGTTSACVGDDDTMCLQDDRFAIEGTWRLADGRTGRAHVTKLSGQSGTVWFFDPANAEVLIKVLDACSFAGQPAYWVFYAPTTNVDFSLRVTDTRTGLTREYGNLMGSKADSVQDVSTFQTCN